MCPLRFQLLSTIVSPHRLKKVVFGHLLLLLLLFSLSHVYLPSKLGQEVEIWLVDLEPVTGVSFESFNFSALLHHLRDH